MEREALKLALEALGWADGWRPQGLKDKAIAAIKDALAQPEQEPVAWMHPVNKTCVTTDPTAYARGTPLYTAPPQRTWVELEGEEIRNLWEEATKPDRSTMAIVTSFARAIAAKLKEKNT